MTTVDPGAAEAKILIVDDQESLRTLILAALKRRRLRADSAHDGQSAIDALKKGHYRVLALDLMMPVVSGWDVLEWLSRNRDRKPHSVIVVSATDRDVMQRLDPTIVNAIIFKPFDVVELSAYIGACCNSSTAADRRKKRLVGKA